MFPILFDDSRHSRGRIPQPIRFPLLQVVQNLGRLTFRSQMHVCQDSKRCPPLLWSLDDQHVE